MIYDGTVWMTCLRRNGATRKISLNVLSVDGITSGHARVRRYTYVFELIARGTINKHRKIRASCRENAISFLYGAVARSAENLFVSPLAFNPCGWQFLFSNDKNYNYTRVDLNRSSCYDLYRALPTCRSRSRSF